MIFTVGSLFSGVGGFDLGFEAAGFRIAWQCEIDPHAQGVLRRHWPDVPLYGDIRELRGADLEPVDVIIFGSPCQGLSVAGQRRGFEDERSGLFHEAIRVIAECCPAWALWENVAGALSSADGRDFGAALDALADSGAVAIGWRVLDAQFFGVPQRRRRLFTLAGFRDGADPAAVLFESQGVCGDPSEGRQAGQEIAAAVTASAGHHGHSSPRGDGSDNPVIASALATRSQRNNPQDQPFIVASAGFAEYQESAMGTLRANGGDLQGGSESLVIAPVLSVPLSTEHAGDDLTRDQLVVAFDNHNGASSDSSATLRAQSHGALPMVADTLLSPVGDGRRDKVPLSPNPTAVRRLTPLECERLQGWPDNWTAGQPDSTRYRQIGNGVASPVAAWIARRLLAQRENAA